jgi:hypothetical protein
MLVRTVYLGRQTSRSLILPEYIIAAYKSIRHHFVLDFDLYVYKTHYQEYIGVRAAQRCLTPRSPGCGNKGEWGCQSE